MEKTEKPKITQALLEECMKAHEEACKSGTLPTHFMHCVFSTPATPQQKQEEKSKDQK